MIQPCKYYVHAVIGESSGIFIVVVFTIQEFFLVAKPANMTCEESKYRNCLNWQN